VENPKSGIKTLKPPHFFLSSKTLQHQRKIIQKNFRSFAEEESPTNFSLRTFALPSRSFAEEEPPTDFSPRNFALKRINHQTQFATDSQPDPTLQNVPL
jgi:hypothetical protein